MFSWISCSLFNGFFFDFIDNQFVKKNVSIDCLRKISNWSSELMKKIWLFHIIDWADLLSRLIQSSQTNSRKSSTWELNSLCLRIIDLRRWWTRKWKIAEVFSFSQTERQTKKFDLIDNEMKNRVVFSLVVVVVRRTDVRFSSWMIRREENRSTFHD